MESLEFRAMGSRIHVLLDADEDAAWQAFERVPLWFEEWEQALSRFRPESELSMINRQPNKLIKVGAVFGEVLELALDMEQRSGGLITPAVLPALENLGYDRSFELLGNQAEKISDQRLHWNLSSKGLMWDAQSRQVILPGGMGLDFGGVAKGWAAHQAAQRLAVYGPAVVNAGGDIAISGPNRDGTPWMIGLQPPFSSDLDLGTLPIYQGGIATSGSDYRRWQQNGQMRHHLIDPRSGDSAQTDLLQVTILAVDVMQAEMAAKLVFLSGKTDGMAWLADHPAYAGLLIKQNGDILQSAGLIFDRVEEGMI